MQCFIFTCFQLVLKSIQIQKVGVDSLRFHFKNTDSEKSLLRKGIQVVQKYSSGPKIFFFQNDIYVCGCAADDKDQRIWILPVGSRGGTTGRWVGKCWRWSGNCICCKAPGLQPSPHHHHHHRAPTITTSADLKSLNCSEKIISWSGFCLQYDGSNGASHGNVVVSFKFFPHSASSRV